MTFNYTPLSDDLQVIPKTVSEPVSLPKEAEPIRSHEQLSPDDVDMLPMHEAVEKQDVEPDLKPFINVKPQNIKIEPDLQKHGLQPIEKLKYKDFQNVVLPLSDENIEKGLHEPITSSLRWLATFATYLLNQSHIKLKVIHGKVVRILNK